jgi:aspartate aminotransferase
MALNETAHQLGVQPSVIREIFSYGQRRKAEIGDDKVFDFSLGNPSIPAPQAVHDALARLIELPPMEIHSYTPNNGLPSTRAAIANSLNRRFDTSYGADDLYMTCGAAASLAVSLTAIGTPGDEMIVISPYFPEYKVWIEQGHRTCVEVPAREDNFQLDLPAIKAAINENTKAIIINSPNNPVGSIYPAEDLEQLADILREADKAYGHPIYLVSDEPYREIVYDADVTVPWVPSIYEYTLVCYSYSKSLSLPGERIGYILVPPEMPGARDVYAAVCGAGRILGFVCAPSLIQRVIEECVDEPTDVEAYRENRDTLYNGLTKLGYECVAPQGAFYLWVKALEPDAQAFQAKAKEHEILLVASDGFGAKGWARIGYCVSHDTIVNSLPAFAALKADYDK